MSDTDNLKLFISHAWCHDGHYQNVVDWLNAAVNFSWQNCSDPRIECLADQSLEGLRQAMSEQIDQASIVILLTGMCATQYDWIEYIVEEAQARDKKIIGLKPWGGERIPVNIQFAVDQYGIMLRWESSQLIKAIRNGI